MLPPDAISELCALMATGELTAEVFDEWVSRAGPLGAPRSPELARLRVRQFDAFLMQPGTEDWRFSRALIGLRNVFARHAHLPTPSTVVLESHA
ncbi:MAG: hypothetical protein Q8L48_19690 [Archangium sp.]|nr:hypothetical protein [Archangium sp.]